MNAERVFNLLGSIVTMATVTVVLTAPQTRSVIRESANFFVGSIRAAMGR